MNNIKIILAAAILAAITAAPSFAGDYPSRAEVTVVRVIDADTFWTALIWGKLRLEQKVRLRGWQSPETTWRAACAAEKEKGLEAKAYIESLIPPGSVVILSDIAGGKFADRIEATVALPDGRDLGETLAGAGHVKPAHRSAADVDWCSADEGG